MRFCTKCLYSELKPGIEFNEAGVCNACLSNEKKDKQIDWQQREKEFRQLIEKYRKKSGYDCIIPVSGGKDSTYQVVMAKKYGLNPLAVCFESSYTTPLGYENLSNLQRIGVDVVHFKKNEQVYKKLVIEGFKKVGDESWINHIGIFTVPIHFAIKFQVPMIIWGENPQFEYGGPDNYAVNMTMTYDWLRTHGGMLGMDISSFIGYDGITEKELSPYIYPTDIELKTHGVLGLFLGHFFKWDANKNVEIAEEYGFKRQKENVEGTYTNYEGIDDEFGPLHDYLKYVKLGYGRCTDQASRDIRYKVFTRPEGIELVKKFDGNYPVKAVQKFCEYTGMTKEEADKIIDSYTNKKLFQTDGNGKFLRKKDFSLVPSFQIS